MVLKLSTFLQALLILAGLGLPSMVSAHKEHQRNQAQTRQADAERAGPASPDQAMDPAMHNRMGGMTEETEGRASMSTVARLLDWLGRLHPVIVHFPIAFFPAALFTAIVGRRRSAFAKPVQFLVVAGGIIAPAAMVLGWFDGGLTFTDTDPLLLVHRWLGTAIGLAGLALAVWAWRRPEEDRRPGMIWGLAAVTVAIVVQGWFGGALVHGADHMDW